MVARLEQRHRLADCLDRANGVEAEHAKPIGGRAVLADLGIDRIDRDGGDTNQQIVAGGGRRGDVSLDQRVGTIDRAGGCVADGLHA